MPVPEVAWTVRFETSRPPARTSSWKVASNTSAVPATRTGLDTVAPWAGVLTTIAARARPALAAGAAAAAITASVTSARTPMMRVCQGGWLTLRSVDWTRSVSLRHESDCSRSSGRCDRDRGRMRVAAARRAARMRAGAARASRSAAARRISGSSTPITRSSPGRSSATWPRCRRSTSKTRSAVGRDSAVTTILRRSSGRVRLDRRHVLHVLQLLVVGGADDQQVVPARGGDDQRAVPEALRPRCGRRASP